MSKVLAFPNKPRTNVATLEAYRKRNSVFDLAKHRKALIALQAEVRQIKRTLLRMVKDDGTSR